MQILVLLHEGKFYTSITKEEMELPSDYDEGDYWTDWKEVEAEDIDDGFKTLIDRLWGLFELGTKSGE